MARIEKQKVKKSFTSHAEHYEALATVQKRVAERFFDLFMWQAAATETLLDVGSGTGRFVGILEQRMPHIEITGVDLAYGMISCARKRFSCSPGIKLACGDAEALPFKDCSFDMVVSTSTYQWLNPLESAFAEAWRVLKPGGRFCFALFGEKTLFELRDSYNSAVAILDKKHPDRTHRFLGCVDVSSALDSATFGRIAVFDELEIERYPDVYSLVHAVNGIGAGSAAGTSVAGLSGRSVMLKMMDIYKERYGGMGFVPATYQVLYGTGTKVV